MANAPIPGLPVAITLDGTEEMEVVQPPGSTLGVSKRATTGQIAALAATGGSPPSSPFVTTTTTPGLANSRALAVTSDLTLTDHGAQSSIVVGPITTAAITFAKFQQIGGLSVVGVSSNGTSIIDQISGAADQVLRVNSAGTGLGFGTLNMSASVTGILQVSNGGLGTSTLTVNGVLVGNGASSVHIATANTAGYILTDNGTASAPTFQAPTGLSQQPGLSILGVTGNATGTPTGISGTTDQVLRISHNGTALIFGAVNLATSAAVTGTLPLSNGGMGATSFTAFGIIYGNGTSTPGVTGAGAAGQLLIGQTSTSAPSFQTIAGDITVTAAGTATIGAGTVTFSKFQTMTGLSVIGVTGTATANASTIVGTAGQVLVVNSAGTGLLFGQVNLAATTSGVTGILPIANGGTNATTAAQGIINLSGLALNTTGQAFTGGVVLTPFNLGTAASSTLTFVAGNPPIQKVVINGTATFVAPSSDCEFDIMVTNAGSASTITFSGYTGTTSTGDSYASTNGSSYILMSRTINAISTYAWKFAK